MGDALVVLEMDDRTRIATIWFNRPERLNALDLKTAVDFSGVIEQLSSQPEIRCVLLRGKGQAFLAGGDVSEMAESPVNAAQFVGKLLEILNPAILKLRALDVPIIAGVHGAVAGAGLSIALMADLIIASDNTRFLLAYGQLGTTPDCGGSWALKHRIGNARAMRLMLFNLKLTSHEALAIGLIDKTVSNEDFAYELKRMAVTIANGPSKAYAEYRRLIEIAGYSSLKSHLDIEKTSFENLTHTSDFKEGVSAFIEKRFPKFTGR